jgi:peptidoglycan/LPS O-acetylase OafA/YrhL
VPILAAWELYRFEVRWPLETLFGHDRATITSFFRFVRTVLLDVPMLLLAAWLVPTAARGFGGVAGRLLDATPTRFAGRISYGMYMLQMAVGAPILARLSPPGPRSMFHIFPSAAALAAVFLAGTVSWYVLERPIYNLKRFVPYKRPKLRGEIRVTVFDARHDLGVGPSVATMSVSKETHT